MLFFMVTKILYYTAFKNYQMILLLIASYFFYGMLSLIPCGFIFVYISDYQICNRCVSWRGFCRKKLFIGYLVKNIEKSVNLFWFLGYIIEQDAVYDEYHDIDVCRNG